MEVKVLGSGCSKCRAMGFLDRPTRYLFFTGKGAPTGHSLLLMDATGGYHRQVMREYVRGTLPKNVICPTGRGAMT